MTKEEYNQVVETIIDDTSKCKEICFEIIVETLISDLFQCTLSRIDYFDEFIRIIETDDDDYYKAVYLPISHIKLIRLVHKKIKN